MTPSYTALFVTERGTRHQQAARQAAPPTVQVTMLRRPSQAELLSRLPHADFLISERSGTIDAEMVAAGCKLRLIQRLGSLGHDIDLEAARSAGIPVSILPIRTVILVAEHMVMQMLSLAKQITRASAIPLSRTSDGPPPRRTDEDTFAYNWSGLAQVGGLINSTIGILGFGEVGVELARRLQGFGPAQILYHKRRRLPPAVETELGVTYANFNYLVASSTFLCNLLPYFPETDLLIDGETLARMPQGAFLVSCGSGSVVDESALARALLSGHIGGAALDTYEWEPIRPDNPLIPLAKNPQRNVLLTPHIAAGSAPAGSERGRDYVNINRVLRGESILNRVA